MGFSQRLSSLMSGFLSLFYYLSTLIPIFIIDRIGRRPLLLIGLVGMAMGMCILAGTTSVTAFGPGVAATVALFWYDFWFGVGWIPGPWLLTAEYAPLVTRSHSAAFSTSATWLFTFVVAEITPPAISNIGWKTYVIFAVLNVSFIPLVYFFYPEVSPKSYINSKIFNLTYKRPRESLSSKLTCYFQALRFLLTYRSINLTSYKRKKLMSHCRRIDFRLIVLS